MAHAKTLSVSIFYYELISIESFSSWSETSFPVRPLNGWRKKKRTETACRLEWISQEWQCGRIARFLCAVIGRIAANHPSPMAPRWTEFSILIDSVTEFCRVLLLFFFVGFSLFFFYFFFNISTAFVDRSQVAHATPAGAGVSMFLTGTSITFYGS